MYIVGIDGGGTKTVGYLSDTNGNILSVAKSSSSNYLSAGVEKAEESLKEVLKSLCISNNITFDDILLISLGLAGVGREKDKQVIKAILIEIGIKGEKLINNDAYISLVGAHGKSEGVITISGTGSITLGLDGNGKLFRVGGWGHILGDEGSGYYFGREGLMAMVKSYDGRESPTSITDKILNYLSFSTVDEIISYVYNNLDNKIKISSLSKLVVEAAEEGDSVAKKIITEGLAELVNMTMTVVKQMDNNLDIALSGGIFENSILMKRKFREMLLQQKPKLNIIENKYNPGIGALIVGWEHMKVKYDNSKLLKQIKDVDIYV